MQEDGQRKSSLLLLRGVEQRAEDPEAQHPEHEHRAHREDVESVTRDHACGEEREQRDEGKRGEEGDAAHVG